MKREWLRMMMMIKPKKEKGEEEMLINMPTSKSDMPSLKKLLSSCRVNVVYTVSS